MEILSTLNFEQLGTAGIFIAYLIWQNSKLNDVIKSVEDERKEWQGKAFDITRETQKELFEATQLFERMLEKVRS